MRDNKHSPPDPVVWTEGSSCGYDWLITIVWLHSALLMSCHLILSFMVPCPERYHNSSILRSIVTQLTYIDTRLASGVIISAYLSHDPARSTERITEIL